MGKHKQFREIEPGVNAPIWVHRINKLLQTEGVTQQELAEACNLPPSRISDWVGINKKKTGQFREPRIEGFTEIARFFKVSVDYLLGEDECKEPCDEEIHKILGLSDTSIQRLKRINNAQTEDSLAEKQICVLNYILENMNDTPLLEDMYDYLLGDFAFPGKDDDLGAVHMVERLPSGKQRRNLTFKEVFAQATFVNVQHDLMHLKDKSMKRNTAVENTVTD